MRRLTIKNQLKNGLVEYLSHETRDADYACIQKLGRYEDIEDELGIDLVTLIKALKNGIYCYNDGGSDILFERIEHFVPYMPQQLHTRGRLSIIHGIKSEEKEKHFAIKDYGKTWALTKEELE